MDDFDFYDEGYSVIENDNVTVFGQVDDDTFETNKIEASSVYVEDLGTSFYANSANEEDFYAWTITAPIVVGQAEITGTVQSVSGRAFTIGDGLGSVRVDTATLPYNPVDEMGFLQIDVGDRVNVSGDIDTTLFDRGAIKADWIVELNG